MPESAVQVPSPPPTPAAPGERDSLVDVCLYLEGTWPYVRGGVSTWVDQVLRALPEIRFGVVYIGADRETAGEPKYPMPDNVVAFRELFLFEPATTVTSNGTKGRSRVDWAEVHETLRSALLDPSPGDTGWLEALSRLTDLASQVSFDQFWRHPGTWKLLQEIYQQEFGSLSFIDFFWNARFLGEPAWRLLEAVDDLPRARVHHAVSTGYAGLLGSLVARRQPGSAFLLSEHGIYVRERIADLLQLEWAPPPHSPDFGDPDPGPEVAPLRRLWIEFFLGIGRLSYHSARSIVSLFHRNAVIQTEFGAPADRICLIPNGIDQQRFEAAREARHRKRAADPERCIIGFLGRVVAIKDVKTLLRAARFTLDLEPRARFLLVGPTDEDPVYFAECRQLVDDLGLSRVVHFSGPASPEQALPEFDLMVLSSASEGLPFAILEAFAAEIPVVSTDVGACAELVHGRKEGGDPHGSAGGIVPVADPRSLGTALAILARDRDLQDRCGAAGLARVRNFYAEADVIQAYRTLYQPLATA